MMPVIDPVLLKRVRERIDRIIPMLFDVKARREWEVALAGGCHDVTGSAAE